MIERFMKGYDFNIELNDAMNDPAVRMSRRLLAGASVEQAISDAYMSAKELQEAYRVRAADIRVGLSGEESLGQDMIKDILLREGCDAYQRKIDSILFDLDLDDQLADIEWLVEVLGRRVDMVKELREKRVPILNLPGYTGPIEDVGCRPYGH